MAPDFYADARDLADVLRALGRTQWADRIRDDIRSGSTGTEILMALRSTLAELDGAIPDLPDATRQELVRQMEALNVAVQ